MRVGRISPIRVQPDPEGTSITDPSLLRNGGAGPEYQTALPTYWGRGPGAADGIHNPFG